jgi:hypothetical protein
MYMPKVFRMFAALALSLLLLALAGAFAAAQEEPGGSQPPSSEVPQEEPPIPQQTEMSSVLLYFFLNGELAGTPRSNIPGGGQMVEFTINDLLAGPSEEEKAQGYVTYIPEGVKLMYSTKSMVGNSYSVNLSKEMMQLAGDREAATKALQQVARTLREVAHTDDIGITISVDDSNQPEDAFQALGVDPKEAGVAGGDRKSASGPALWMIILIIVGAVALVQAVLVPLFLKARRAERAFLAGENPGKGSPR